MAHWAQIDENNKVVLVTVGSNDDADEGYQWLIDNFGGVWVQTSYNTSGGVHSGDGVPFRYNYAGIGFTFDPDKGTNGAFIPPKPFESWVLNEDTCLWEAPIPYPQTGAEYSWNEEAGDWVEVTGE